jgi:hypothetical protein|tara:strand:- start:1582 stop:2781 length:1200 start_codon:yes stop_codon:yes gene_type:complete
MLKKIKQSLFPLLIAFSALSVSASAAFYSVSGLSKLFAGAAFAVIVMAASLEIAKLVIASLLYQYRKNLPKLLKWYLSIACFVLIVITSMGIYGFLSAAYQETAAKAGTIDSQIALVEVKRDNVKEQLVVYNEEKSSINEAVVSLRNGLSTNRIQYKDTLGNIITTQSSTTRRVLTQQLDQAIDRQTEINYKIDQLNEALFKFEEEIVEIRLSDAVSSELGPLKYLSGLTGYPMDRIINWLLLTIIFVFDPLAIALVVAANFAFEQIRPKTKKNLYREEVIIDDEEEDNNWVEEGYYADNIEDEADERMNIIGQNGNEGLHYEDETDYLLSSEKNKEHLEESIQQADSIDNLDIQELEELKSRTAKTNKYGPKGWKTIDKRINELRARKNDDDDLIIRY